MFTASKKAKAFNTFFTTCFNQSFPQLTLEYAPDLPPQDCSAEMLCTEMDVFKMHWVPLKDVARMVSQGNCSK